MVEGVTGAFFREQTTEALTDVVSRFDKNQFEPPAIRAHAEQFDTRLFKSKLMAVVRRQMGE